MSTGGSLKKQFTLFPIWAEEGAALANNQREYSFGNGATGNIGITLPVDGEVQFVSIDSVAAGASLSIDLVVNGVDTQTITFTAASQSQALGTPLSINAGDRIGFKTNTETGAWSNTRLCAWIKAEIS